MVQDKQFVCIGLAELQQRNGQEQVVQEYAWDLSAPGGNGGLLITQANKESFTYLYNHLGHVQKVMNSLGQVVANYQYTPYGQVEGDDFSQQPFGYSTKRSDFESGLIYFGYRFYSPYQRCWLNRDPLHEQGGMNLYSYVNGDPLMYVDPDGLWSIKFSRYFGWGAVISFGHNAETGRSWAEFETGYGLEAGFVFDPNDSGAPCCGSALGLDAEWFATLAGLGFQGRTESVGLDVNPAPENNFFGPDLSTNVLGVTKGSSIGGHVGIFGRLVF